MEARQLPTPLALQPLRDECRTEEDYELALRTLHTYIARLLEHPNVPKYKSISQQKRIVSPAAWPLRERVCGHQNIKVVEN